MPARRPKFIYFDLGMVLVTFSVERMCRQMGLAAGVEPGLIERVVFGGDLLAGYERGALSTGDFFDAFCRQTGASVDFDGLVAAASDIFEINAPMLPIVASLQQTRWRLGILSNTCACHWKHCLEHYRVLQDSFDVRALSFELGATKPDPAIFIKAAQMAGVAPEEIVYTDDNPGHVASARSVGYDAVLFTGPEQLAADLIHRGVWLNY